MKYILAIAVNFLALSVASEPMSFQLVSNGGNCTGCEWVAAEGDITPDTPDDFRRYIEEYGAPHFISLHSPGGSLIAGIELGELIRETGATTEIGKTVSMGADYYNNKQTSPGICASACAFAFMGGIERYIGEQDLLGVHQFYSADNSGFASEIIQTLVGYSLIHTLRMGIDAGVIVAASGTSPEEIYWFDRHELVAFGLDTSGSFTDPWVIEPYRSGLVLTTKVHTSTRRSVAVTLFCRAQTGRWHLLIAEPYTNYNQLVDGDFFRFKQQFPSRPTISIGEQSFNVTENDVEFQRLSGDQILVSLFLPINSGGLAGKRIRFDPDLARVFGQLMFVNVELPSLAWLESIGRNCI